MNLKSFFEIYPAVAIAFSGGVDSAYLMYEAKKYAQQVIAYYVKSAFQPTFELEHAEDLAKSLDIPLTVLTVDVLANSTVVKNPENRCYFCKKEIFSTIIDAAKADGLTVILDGTNASDDVNDRPGMKALQELGVLSPLRLCHLTKDTIRERSKKAGLFTWNKPAYACLATRIQTHQSIQKDTLNHIETAESFLFKIGLTDFRVRVRGDLALLQIRADDLKKVWSHQAEILAQLKQWFKTVCLDLEHRP